MGNGSPFTGDDMTSHLDKDIQSFFFAKFTHIVIFDGKLLIATFRPPPPSPPN